MTFELTRWKLRRPGPAFAVQRDLIAEPVAPTLSTIGSSLEYYVSRQGDNEVWFTVVGAPPNASANSLTAIDTALAADLAERCTSSTDALLHTAAADYRKGLKHATDLAVELLLAPDYQAHQRFLVLATCSGEATPRVLEAYCTAHSASHRALGDAERRRFWFDFYTFGHRPELSYYGHWLWNILVGPQPSPGDDPWRLLRAIGAV